MLKSLVDFFLTFSENSYVFETFSEIISMCFQTIDSLFVTFSEIAMYVEAIGRHFCNNISKGTVVNVNVCF